MRKANNHICRRHQLNQKHNPNDRDENAPKHHGTGRNKTNLRHTGHCKIDETVTGRVESTHQQNGRQ